MPVSDNFLFDPVQKFGRIPDIDAAGANEDVWDGEGVYPGFLAAATAMTVSSSSADDVSTSTGAWKVRIFGLNASFVEVVQDVNLNGQTAVPIPISLIRVYRMYVLTAGTGGVNAGNIWVGSGAVGAGVPANKYAANLIGMGQTLMATYTIPVAASTGQTYTGGQLKSWYATAGAAKGAYATIAILTREFGGAWRTRRIRGVAEGGPFDEHFDFGIELGTKADIRVRVVVNGEANTAIAAGFDIKLRQKQ